MSAAPNWTRIRNRERSVRTSIALGDVLAHLRAIDAAECREGPPPNKAELRAMAAEAVAQFRGTIRRLPAEPRRD
jgi:hypothetical protein